MTEAVVAVDSHEEAVTALSGELRQREVKARQLELAVARKDAELRRAREESALLRELRTVNQLARRKMDTDANRPNRMPISEESLARIIALEDELKLATKEAKELQDDAVVIQKQMERTDNAIATYTSQVTEIKEATGYDRHQYAARGYVDPENLFRFHQKQLLELETEQNLLKKSTQKLTDRIAELSAELEERKQVEEQMFQAREMLKQCEKDYRNATEDLKSLQRIAFRKGKLLQRTEGVDDAKRLRMLEGDKRVLHAELIKNKEVTLANEKSILSSDLKLRQLEGKLAAINAFLATALVKAPDAAEGEENAVTVSKFEEVRVQLEEERFTLSKRDEALEELDLSIEALEKKYSVLRAASVSRTAMVAQEEQEREREQAAVNERVLAIEEDFRREYDRLVVEKNRLESHLALLTEA